MVWSMFFSNNIWDVILPIDELIFFRGVGIPPTSYIWISTAIPLILMVTSRNLPGSVHGNRISGRRFNCRKYWYLQPPSPCLRGEGSRSPQKPWFSEGSTIHLGPCNYNVIRFFPCFWAGWDYSVLLVGYLPLHIKMVGCWEIPELNGGL